MRDDTGKIIALAKSQVSPAAIESAVSDWLDDHPEATTTVEDGAVSYAKLDSSLQSTVDDVPALKSAITLDEDILSSESNVTKEVGIYDGLEPGFVDSSGAIYSTGTHSHITISAVGIKTISFTPGSQALSVAAVIGKFNGVYKVVIPSSATSANIADVVDNVEDGDLLYLNFFGEVYNNPIHTGDYPEKFTLTMYSRSERFGIKTDNEIILLADEHLKDNISETLQLESLDVYATGKFMTGTGTLSNSATTEVVSILSKGIKEIKFQSATSAAVAILIEKLGDTVLDIAGKSTTSLVTYVPKSADSTIYFNFFNYATAQDYVKQISVKYNNVFENSGDVIANVVEEKLIFNLVRKPFAFSGKNAVFCGDSITRGYINGTTVTQNGYPKLFSDAVGMTFENKGVGGATICVVSGGDSILTQVQAVNTGTADFVFIAGGVNDWQTGQTLADFETAVNNMCDYINSNYPNNLPVIWITPINQGGWEVTHEISPKAELKEFRRVMTESILKKDTYARFSVIQGEWFNFPTKNGDYAFIAAMFGDRLHPTELGYKALYTPGLLTALC